MNSDLANKPSKEDTVIQSRETKAAAHYIYAKRGIDTEGASKSTVSCPDLPSTVGVRITESFQVSPKIADKSRNGACGTAATHTQLDGADCPRKPSTFVVRGATLMEQERRSFCCEGNVAKYIDVEAPLDTHAAETHTASFQTIRESGAATTNNGVDVLARSCESTSAGSPVKSVTSRDETTHSTFQLSKAYGNGFSEGTHSCFESATGKHACSSIAAETIGDQVGADLFMYAHPTVPAQDLNEESDGTSTSLKHISNIAAGRFVVPATLSMDCIAMATEPSIVEKVLGNNKAKVITSEISDSPPEGGVTAYSPCRVAQEREHPTVREDTADQAETAPNCSIQTCAARAPTSKEVQKINDYCTSVEGRQPVLGPYDSVPVVKKMAATPDNSVIREKRKSASNEDAAHIETANCLLSSHSDTKKCRGIVQLDEEITSIGDPINDRIVETEMQDLLLSGSIINIAVADEERHSISNDDIKLGKVCHPGTIEWFRVIQEMTHHETTSIIDLISYEGKLDKILSKLGGRKFFLASTEGDMWLPATWKDINEWTKKAWDTAMVDHIRLNGVKEGARVAVKFEDKANGRRTFYTATVLQHPPVRQGVVSLLYDDGDEERVNLLERHFQVRPDVESHQSRDPKPESALEIDHEIGISTKPSESESKEGATGWSVRTRAARNSEVNDFEDFESRTEQPRDCDIAFGRAMDLMVTPSVSRKLCYTSNGGRQAFVSAVQRVVEIDHQESSSDAKFTGGKVKRILTQLPGRKFYRCVRNGVWKEIDKRALYDRCKSEYLRCCKGYNPSVGRGIEVKFGSEEDHAVIHTVQEEQTTEAQVTQPRSCDIGFGRGYPRRMWYTPTAGSTAFLNAVRSIATEDFQYNPLNSAFNSSKRDRIAALMLPNTKFYRHTEACGWREATRADVRERYRYEYRNKFNELDTSTGYKVGKLLPKQPAKAYHRPGAKQKLLLEFTQEDQCSHERSLTSTLKAKQRHFSHSRRRKNNASTKDESRRTEHLARKRKAKLPPRSQPKRAKNAKTKETPLQQEVITDISVTERNIGDMLSNMIEDCDQKLEAAKALGRISLLNGLSTELKKDFLKKLQDVPWSYVMRNRVNDPNAGDIMKRQGFHLFAEKETRGEVHIVKLLKVLSRWEGD